METSNFYSIIPHLKTFYGMNVTEDELEDIGLDAWEKIGNRHTSMYSISGETRNCEFQLPCNFVNLEAVTNDTIPYFSTDNKLAYNHNNLLVEENIYRLNDSFFQTKGSFIDHEVLPGNILRFKNDHRNVNILYKGLFLDGDGLPFLSSKEVSAIADFVAYVVTFKDAMVARDRVGMELSSVLERKWQKSCYQARVPNYINQNEWDKILNAKASWNRKNYNVSYKPVF